MGSFPIHRIAFALFMLIVPVSEMTCEGFDGKRVAQVGNAVAVMSVNGGHWECYTGTRSDDGGTVPGYNQKVIRTRSWHSGQTTDWYHRWKNLNIIHLEAPDIRAANSFAWKTARLALKTGIEARWLA
jgi:hypothetical protein